MARSLAEWIGEDDNRAAPARVRLRVFERDGGRCQCGCGILIRPGDKWETDHTRALINGGENREGNLRTLLSAHHKTKTQTDMAEKARTTRIRSKHIGLKQKPKGRPIPGTKASGWKRRFDGTVVRREK